MDQPFTAASHHDILALLIQIAVLLLAARLLGELALRLKQPSVVGEILAGILLGPSLLGGFVPAIQAWIIPQTPEQGYLLETISLLGVMFLLLITGLEIDLALIRRQARSAVGIAIGGLSFTLSIGFLLGHFIPDDLLVNPDQRVVFALFLATALAISALPVIAKVLVELKLTRRDAGQTIIAAAMIDDTTGWILLSIVAGLASGAAVNLGAIGQSLGNMLLFLAVSFTAGRWLVKRALNFVYSEVTSRDRILSLVVILMFAWGALSQALHLEAMLGAFVVGILFGLMPVLDIETIHKLESVAFGVFSPVFFAVAGLKVSIRSLLEPRLIGLTLLLIGVAVFCKIVGVYLGSRLIGKAGHWTALFYGSGLNARGSMGIIVASIGLSLNIVTQDMFSMIVVMAVVTSLMAPAALRWTLKHMQPDEQEMERLRREELNRENVIASARRVLLPVRYRDPGIDGAVQTVEAQILERLGANKSLSITLFNVAKPGEQQRNLQFLNRLAENFGQHELSKRLVAGDRAGDLILDEARKGYDLLVLGASDKNAASSEALFTPLVDYVIRLAPSITLLVHGRRVQPGWNPKRILVPTNGSQASKRAAEVAFALAVDGDEQVIFLNVVEAEDDDPASPSYRRLQRQLTIAHQIVDDLQKIGSAYNVYTAGEVHIHRDPETVILETAGAQQVDLIILGTSVHAATDHLYLGPRVERVLSSAPCPVIVVNS